jgi:hypothetical protein
LLALALLALLAFMLHQPLSMKGRHTGQFERKDGNWAEFKSDKWMQEMHQGALEKANLV